MRGHSGKNTSATSEHAGSRQREREALPATRARRSLDSITFAEVHFDVLLFKIAFSIQPLRSCGGCNEASTEVSRVWSGARGAYMFMNMTCTCRSRARVTYSPGRPRAATGRALYTYLPDDLCHVAMTRGKVVDKSCHRRGQSALVSTRMLLAAVDLMPKAAERILFMSSCVIVGCNVAGVAMPSNSLARPTMVAAMSGKRDRPLTGGTSRENHVAELAPRPEA